MKGNDMLSQKRLETLQKKKDKIASQIDRQEKRSFVDTTYLRQLKKEKLQITEVMHGIRQES